MENILIYQKGSETIRQMPQSYLIAYKNHGNQVGQPEHWICEPDISADKKLATRVFLALFDYDTKYGDGLNLLSKVTPNSQFKED